MSTSELAWRSLHDIGLAGWFGGSVFGSVALPREPSQLPDSPHGDGTRQGNGTKAAAPTGEMVKGFLTSARDALLGVA